MAVGKRVILVDDSDTVRRMLMWALRPTGVDIIEASNGKIAIDCLERESVDLAIVDLNMPVMDGITLIRKLRASSKWRDLPIIMLTTESRDPDMKMAHEAGANMYLVKPSTPEIIQYKTLSLLQLQRDPDGPPAAPVLPPARTSSERGI